VPSNPLSRNFYQTAQLAYFNSETTDQKAATNAMTIANERSKDSCHQIPTLLVLTQRGAIAAPVIELRGARVGMVCHLTRSSQRPVTLEVVGDAGCAQGVIADLGFNAHLARVALDHAIGVLLRHAVRGASRPPRGAEERPVPVPGDAGCPDVFIQVAFQLVMAGCLMLLATLLVQAHPAAAPRDAASPRA